MRPADPRVLRVFQEQRPNAMPIAMPVSIFKAGRYEDAEYSVTRSLSCSLRSIKLESNVNWDMSSEYDILACTSDVINFEAR